MTYRKPHPGMTLTEWLNAARWAETRRMLVAAFFARETIPSPLVDDVVPPITQHEDAS